MKVPQPTSRATLFCLASLLALTPVASAQLPVNGWPVPELAAFDDAMQDFMDQYGLLSGVLAVSRNGCIVYQRGFGFLDFFPSATQLPENTPMRIASVEKPITSAAIRQLEADNIIEWTDRVFNLGQPGGGILQHTPWNGVGDNRLDDIDVQDVFNHRGGWDRGTAAIGDPQFRAIQIANAMGVSSPPGRDNTIRFMLSQPLQFNPGANGCMDGNGNPTFCYSNFGYMCLGRIIETVTGTSYINYIRNNILTPGMWVPATEIFTGRTFGANQSPREPLYFSGDCTNVFDPSGDPVACAYGGWEHELFIGHGNLVCSAAPLLVYMDNYQVGVGGAAGTPLSGGTGMGAVHNGAIDGTSSVMWQRGDGINIVVLFNERVNNDNPHVATAMAQIVSDMVDGGGITWPTECVDGAWVDFNGSNSLQVGGFNAPYKSMPTVMGSVAHGTKLRFKPGVSNWSGTINRKLLIDAPFGTARIGG